MTFKWNQNHWVEPLITEYVNKDSEPLSDIIFFFFFVYLFIFWYHRLEHFGSSWIDTVKSLSVSSLKYNRRY